MTEFQTIVLGLGAMGSAVCYQLAKEGHHVLGLDRYAPPHQHGSTHGGTRITRLAIGEGEDYTPLAMRSHEIWRQIEAETGRDLLTQCGALMISSDGAHSEIHVPGFFENTIAAAQKFGIGHTTLDTGEIRRRFPQFAVREGERAYYEPEAGFLRVEECVRAQLELAARHGAELRTNEQVLGFRASASAVEVQTAKAAYRAENFVIAAGPWLPSLIGSSYAGLFRVTRQVQYWFGIAPERESLFEPRRCPVYLWELPDRPQAVYGFPAADGAGSGVKIATEQNETTTTPDEWQAVGAREIEAMYRDYVEPYFPDLTLPALKHTTCLYTVAPGGHFVIDRHPDYPGVWVISACSGHGFKHSAAIGEAVAEQIVYGESRIDLSGFTFASLRP